jgi:predicted NBD/HSP70 family sugar kinase
MNILVIDVGGTNVKLLATGHEARRKFSSGPTLTPHRLVAGVKDNTKDWQYEVVTIGYPGVVRAGHIVTEPYNLAAGWIGFDFERALGRPVRIVNDAAMQALGNYEGGTMLFVGLGTGMAAAVVVDGTAVPMEVAHLGYRKGTYEDYLGLRGLERLGKAKWQRHVEIGVARLIAAFRPDDVVIGGGNAKKLVRVPPGCRLSDNMKAFVGGFRVWADAREVPPRSTAASRIEVGHA